MANLAEIGFRADTSELKQAATVLNSLGPASSKAEKAASKLSGAVDTTGKAAKRATDALGGTATATDGLSSRAGRAATATERLAQSMERGYSATGRFTRAANDNATATGRMASEATRAQRAMATLGQASEGANTRLASLARNAVGAAAAMASVGAAVGFGRSIIQTSAEFQRLEVALTTVIGSADKARQAMDFAKQFATKTPFDVQQVIEAMITLKARGLVPTEAALISFGNTASAMGKPLSQFIEAIADATSGGGFERLAEFGIKAKQEGDKVSLTFQGMTTTIGNNAKEIEKYLYDIGNVNFAGGMDKQSKTLGGALSNVGDAIVNLQNKIGEGGFADAIQNVANDIATLTASNGQLAESFGGFLGQSITNVSNEFKGFVADITEIVNWTRATINVFGELASTFTVGGTQMVGATDGMVVAASIFQDAWTAVGRAMYDIINGMIGLVVGAYEVVVNQWDQLPAAFASIAQMASNALVAGIQNAINSIIGGINSLFSSINSIAPEFAQLGELGTVSLEQFQVAVDDTGVKALRTADSIMTQATQTDYLAAGMKAAIEPLQDFGDRIAAAKDGIDQSAKAAADLAAANAAVKVEMPSMGAAATSAGSQIDSGLTKPSKEAAKALRDANAAKNALFSEADAAFEKFFPLEHAANEAARLDAIIADTTNGLSDMQRAALSLKIGETFKEANDSAKEFSDNAVDGVKRVGQEIEESIGDTFASVFSNALNSSDGFFKSLISGFASIGQAGAKKGLESIFASLTGIPSGNAQRSQSVTSGGGSSSASLSSTLQAGVSSLSQTLSKPVQAVVQSSDFAKASGAMMQYSSRFNSNVDSRLTKILSVAASRFDQPITSISGRRVGDPRFHGQGLATDVKIGNLANYQDGSTFRTYEKFAQLSKQVQQELFPELEGMLRWGGYFSGGKGKYGALDTMHFDLAGNKVGMGGGSFENGLTASQRKLFPNAQSIGMSSTNNTVAVKATQQAVSKGVTQSLDKWAGLRTTTAQPAGGAQSSGGGGLLSQLFGGGGSSSSGGGGALSGLMSVGGNILSAGANGYQSGSPIMGGLSGALSGFAAGGPLGAVVGGISGLVGGIFGGKAQRAAEHKAKAEEWAAMAPEWEAYQSELKTGKGPTSNLRENMKILGDQLIKFVDRGSRAWKNGTNNSSALYSSVSDDLGKYYTAMVTGFDDKFQSTVDSLTLGKGLTTEFDTVREKITGLADELLTFIDDAQYRFVDLPKSANAEGDPAKVEEARVAAQKQLLAVFDSSVKPMTEVESAMKNFEAAAKTLQPYLVQMGMAAEDASAAIQDKLTSAIKSLGEGITQGLQDELNALDGKAYLTDFRALVQNRDSMMSDAKLANVDTSLVDVFFKKKAQSMVDGAELAGTAFDELIKAFPTLDGVVTAFAGTVDDLTDTMTDAAAVASRILSYTDRMDDATGRSGSLAVTLSRFERKAAADRATEVAAGGAASLQLEATLAAEKVRVIEDLITQRYEVERSEIEKTKSRYESLSKELGSYLDQLKLDPNLSPLDAKGRLDEARSQYDKVKAAAAAGDENAQQELTNVSQNLLNEAKDYYATSEQYYAVFNEVSSTIENAKSVADRQLDIAKQQLSVIDAQLATMKSIDSSIDDLATAIQALAGAQAAANAAAAATTGTGTATPGGKVIDGFAQGTVNPGLSYLSANPDVAAAVAAGETFGLPKGLGAGAYAAAHYGLFGVTEGRNYASGGLITGPGNGMSDSVNANLSAGEFVISKSSVDSIGASNLQYMNDYGYYPNSNSAPDNENDNSELVDTMKMVGKAVVMVGEQLVASDEQTRRQLNKLREAMDK